MWTELWNNKHEILNNYWTILKPYKYLIFCCIALLFLLGVYLTISIISWRQKQHNGKNNIAATLASATLDTGYHTATITITDTDISEKTHELFTNNTPPQLTLEFIQPGDYQCGNLMQYLDSIYLVHMNQPNIQARGFDTLAELTQKYHDAFCQPITTTETQYVINQLSQLAYGLSHHKRDYFNKWLSQSKLVKAQPWLEGGMPHTHGPCIILTPKWFVNTDANIVFHEITHIHQRLQPHDFDQLYHNWGFSRVSSTPKGLETIFLRSRINPDALDINWTWTHNTTQYWIGAVYNSINPDSIHDIDFLAYPLAYNGDYLGTQPLKLASWPAFTQYFGNSRNHYHPFEIAAFYMENYLANTSTLKQTTAYPIFESWFNSLKNV